MTKAAELAKMGEVLNNSQIGGRRNIIINGGMNVAQRGTSKTGVGSSAGYFTCDRWKIEVGSTAGRATMTQTADSPNGLSSSCIKLDCTTADTSIAAGEYFILTQPIEAQDLQQLGKGTSDAKEVTLSFYVKANAAFTFVVEFQDIDNSRLNGKTFATTTDWVRHEVTFEADTTGAFGDDNNEGGRINFWLHSGSTYAGGTLPSGWVDRSGNDVNRASGISSFFSSTDNNFFITGVQLEVGSQATPFEHRSFGEELSLCQRYFCQTYPHGTVAGSNSGATVLRKLANGNGYDNIANFHFPTEMRAVPSISLYNPISGTANGFRGDSGNFTGAAINTATTRGVNIYRNATVTATVFTAIHALADAEL